MNPNWLILAFSICIFFTRNILSWFIFSHSAAELNLGQPELVNAAFRTPWGMLFRQKGKEEIPGRCANSAHSATLFKLLRLCVSKKIVWQMVLDCIHGWNLFSFESCFDLNECAPLNERCIPLFIQTNRTVQSQSHCGLTYLIIFCLLHKERFSIVPKLHM